MRIRPPLEDGTRDGSHCQSPCRWLDSLSRGKDTENEPQSLRYPSEPPPMLSSGGFVVCAATPAAGQLKHDTRSRNSRRMRAAGTAFARCPHMDPLTGMRSGLTPVTECSVRAV